MKLTISFLTVLAATATLAKPSRSDSENCFEAYNNKYSVCTVSMSDKSIQSIENICHDFESELCQKYFKSSKKDLYNEFPVCKGYMMDDGSIRNSDSSDSIKETMYYSIKLDCARDEQGILCPYTRGNIQKFHKNIDSMKQEEQSAIYLKYVKESCKSKKCVDEVFNVFDYVENVYLVNKKDKATAEVNQFIQDIYSTLKSETCTSQYGKTSVNGNNNVNTSNVNISSANANDNTVTSSANVNGTTNASNGYINDKTNASNNNANNKTDAKSGATQITYSGVLFAGLAIALSILF